MEYCMRAYDLFHDARICELQDDRASYHILLISLAAHVPECPECFLAYTEKSTSHLVGPAPIALSTN